MSVASDALSRALTQLSNDRRRTVAHYGNVTGREGSSLIPRRLLSDTGFFTDTQFSYIAAAASNLTILADPRKPDRIVFRPYGIREDLQRLLSTEGQDRVERTDALLGGTGITHYPASTDFVMSADLDAGTVGLQKTLNVARQVTDQRGGPAYHAIINRRGDIIICASIDDETSATPDLGEVSIDVALETAIVMSRDDHFDQRNTNLIEIPFVDVQLTTLAVFIAKLRTAYPSIPATIVKEARSAGLSYLWTQEEQQRYVNFGLRPLNFSSGSWRNQDHRFDYTTTDDIQFLGRIVNQGAFDLATEVFRSDQQAPPTSAREIARTAIGTVDTAGAQSVYLGAYASVAAQDRNADLQSMTRRQIFVQRAGVAHHDADSASEQAGAVTEGAEATDEESNTPVVSTGPHVYDFAEGLWLDQPIPSAY